jgi:hypothetical protein
VCITLVIIQFHSKMHGPYNIKLMNMLAFTTVLTNPSNLQCNIQNLTKNHIRQRMKSVMQQIWMEQNVKTRNFVTACVYMNFIVGIVYILHVLFELDISTSVICASELWRNFRMLDSYSPYSWSYCLRLKVQHEVTSHSRRRGVRKLHGICVDTVILRMHKAQTIPS